MFKFLYYMLLYAFSSDTKWHDFIEQHKTRARNGGGSVRAAPKVAHPPRVNGAKATEQLGVQSVLTDDLKPMLVGMTVQEVEELLAYAETLLQGIAAGAQDSDVFRDRLIARAMDIQRSKTGILEHLSPRQRDKLRAVAEKQLLGPVTARVQAMPAVADMSPERRKLIESAMALQRSKAGAFKNLSADQRARLHAIARQQLLGHG